MIKGKVSVIICYKLPAPYLEATLTSVKNQTIFKDIEIVLIKDKNWGLAGARNRGLDKASGEFIFFMDADDVFFNNKVLEKAINYFNLNQDLDFIYGDVVMTDENLVPFKYYSFPFFHQKHLLDFLKIGGMVTTGSIFLRNNSKVRYNESIIVHQDIDYILRRSYKKNGEHVNWPFILYRQHQKSVTARKGKNKIPEIIRSINIYKEFILKYLKLQTKDKDYKIIMAQQTLIRSHILLTLYYKKEAFKIWCKTFKYFPYNLRKKFLRVIIEIFVPTIFSKKIRKFLIKYKKNNYADFTN